MVDTMDLDAHSVTVRRCECGITWAGGNSKYCDVGHAYRFTEEEYVPASHLQGAVEERDRYRAALERAGRALNRAGWIDESQAALDTIITGGR